MVLAAEQEVLEDLEAGGVVVDGEHAHADGELVLSPMPAVGLRLQLHLLDGHLLRFRLRESNSTKAEPRKNPRNPNAPGSPKAPPCMQLQAEAGRQAGGQAGSQGSFFGS